MNLKQELEQRGFLYQYTDEKLFELYQKGGKKFYLGIDPSADSLQLGNLVPIMMAVNLMKYGNDFVLIIGGATGTIGDPSGKDKERQLKTIEEIEENGKKIYNQLQTIISRLQKAYNFKSEIIFKNNYDFYKNMNVLDFLREIGKHMTVNRMMTKESIKRRLQDPERGISYTEFSYMLLQGYDFFRLYNDFGVELQIGGSDQWGNITAGIELIRRKLGKEAYGLTSILLTTSDGKKFGKSEGNAIWLDENKNSAYFVYQYFVNTTDEDVEKFLKILTLLPLEEINKIVIQHKSQPEKRYGQKTLAYEITKFLFGEEKAKASEKISQILFGNQKLEIIKEMNEFEKNELIKEIGGAKRENAELLDFIVKTGLTKSKSETRKLIQQKGISINGQQIDENFKIEENLFINGILLLQRGKKTYKIGWID